MRKMIIYLDQGFCIMTAEQLDEVLACAHRTLSSLPRLLTHGWNALRSFHFGVPFANGMQDAWTDLAGKGLHGLSLEWGDPKTFTCVRVTVLLVPNDDAHGAEAASDLLDRAFTRRFSSPAVPEKNLPEKKRQLAAYVADWTADTASAATATSRKLGEKEVVLEENDAEQEVEVDQESELSERELARRAATADDTSSMELTDESDGDATAAAATMPAAQVRSRSVAQLRRFEERVPAHFASRSASQAV